MPFPTIGDYCNIGQNFFIYNMVIVSDRVKIQNNVSVYNGVTLEEDVFVGPSAVFTNVINPRSFIERKNEFKATLVKKGATIGANATILCGISIGRYAMIGAGAVVTKDVADYAVIVGNPGRQKGWVSEAGSKLVPSADHVAICSITAARYILKAGQLHKINQD
jgi:UDP-2-acetamido-3-amino-2,3-dideoxy-glucuronate N-acetyltransferase